MPSKTTGRGSATQKPQRRGAKPPRRPVAKPAPKPAPVVEAPNAMFETTPPAPSPAEQQSTEIVVTGAPTAPVTSQGADAAQVVETPPAALPEGTTTEKVSEVPSAPPPPMPEVVADPSDKDRLVRLGGVNALYRRMPLSEVLIHMDAFMSRCATLAESQSVLDLQPRMLATEGRCAPIYFLGDPEEGELEHLFDGVEAVTAAIVLGLETVSVIIIDQGDAGVAQAHLASFSRMPPPKNPDDDYLMRVNTYLEAAPPASPA